MSQRQNKRHILPSNYEGQRLKAYMHTHDIRPPELAERLGLGASAVQSYFYRPHFSDVIRHNLSKALGVPYEQIVGMVIDLDSGDYHQGGQLRNYLERKGIQQTHLARVLGRRKTTISTYLQGSILLPSTRRQIAAALEVEESEIFTLISEDLAEQPLLPPPVSLSQLEEAPDARSLVMRQLGEWQRLLGRLGESGASPTQVDFCQYQIWHLELSLPALGLSMNRTAKP